MSEADYLRHSIIGTYVMLYYGLSDLSKEETIIVKTRMDIMSNQDIVE